VVKQLLDEPIDCVGISPDKQVQPFFWVPDEQRPGPSLARARGTPLRVGPHQVQVEVAGIEPASSGAAIGLLRAQPARDCRGRHVCRQQRRPVTNDCVLRAQLV
jgi:hypothetical protein